MLIQNQRTVPFTVLKFHITDLSIHAVKPGVVAREIKLSAIIRKSYPVKCKGVCLCQYVSTKYFWCITRWLLPEIGIFCFPDAFLCI